MRDNFSLFGSDEYEEIQQIYWDMSWGDCYICREKVNPFDDMWENRITE